MAGIEIAFIALKEITFVIKLGNQHMAGGRDQRFVIRKQRRLAWSHVRENNPGAFLAWVGGVAHLFAKAPVGWFAGLFDAAALTVEQPAVIQAAQAAGFDAAVTQVGAAVRAVSAEQTPLAVGAAK